MTYATSRYIKLVEGSFLPLTVPRDFAQKKKKKLFLGRDGNFAPPYLTRPSPLRPCGFSPPCKGDGAGMGQDFRPAPPHPRPTPPRPALIRVKL